MKSPWPFDFMPDKGSPFFSDALRRFLQSIDIRAWKSFCYAAFDVLIDIHLALFNYKRDHYHEAVDYFKKAHIPIIRNKNTAPRAKVHFPKDMLVEMNKERDDIHIQMTLNMYYDLDGLFSVYEECVSKIREH